MDGREVRGRRAERGWTQAQLAAAAGISQPLLSAIESGKRTVTSRQERSLGAVLGIAASHETVVTGDLLDSLLDADISDDTAIGELRSELRRRCGAQLRRGREGADMTVAMAAETLALSGSAWYRWERGELAPTKATIDVLKGPPIYLPAVVAAWWRWPADGLEALSDIPGMMAAELTSRRRNAYTALDLTRAVAAQLPRMSDQRVARLRFVIECLLAGREEGKGRAAVGFSDDQIEIIASDAETNSDNDPYGGVAEAIADAQQALADFSELTDPELRTMMAALEGVTAGQKPI